MSVMDFFEDAWDGFLDGLDYLFSFEWIGDIWDFITGMFDNLNEFSFMGLVFAILVIALIYSLHSYMLEPFLNHMGKFEAVFWGGATYAGSALIGYFVGKKLFDN